MIFSNKRTLEIYKMQLDNQYEQCSRLNDRYWDLHKQLQDLRDYLDIEIVTQPKQVLKKIKNK